MAHGMTLILIVMQYLEYRELRYEGLARGRHWGCQRFAFEYITK